jgi:hypothetical protein
MNAFKEPEASYEACTSKLDSRRGLVMPPGVPPEAVVTLQEYGQDVWLIRRIRSETQHKLGLIPAIDHLQDDPEWDETEAMLGRQISARLPEPEE